MKKGLYLYCIALSSEAKKFTSTGLGRKKVYSLHFKDLALIVHDCGMIPYQSKNSKRAVAWIKSHQKVIEAAWEEYEAILPFSFNTIVKETDVKKVDENAFEWLGEKYDSLLKKLKELAKKAEFGVQISWDREKAASALLKTEASLLTLQDALGSKSEGIQFLLKEKIQKRLRLLLEEKGRKIAQELLSSIEQVVLEYKVESSKEEGMILNLSCLDLKEEPKLGGVLEEIDKKGEFKVRFTGPWPPYSFVNLK